MPFRIDSPLERILERMKVYMKNYLTRFRMGCRFFYYFMTNDKVLICKKMRVFIKVVEARYDTHEDL